MYSAEELKGLAALLEEAQKKYGRYIFVVSDEGLSLDLTLFHTDVCPV